MVIKLFKTLKLILLVTILNSAYASQDQSIETLHSDHEKTMDAFLTAFQIKESALEGFRSSLPKEMDHMKESWQGNKRIESCLRKALSPEMKYRHITLKSFKDAYSKQETEIAYQETKSKFTQKYLNIIFLSAVQGSDPTNKLKEHITENRNEFSSFQKNIKPDRFKTIINKTQPKLAFEYTAVVIDTCIAKNK